MSNNKKDSSGYEVNTIVVLGFQILFVGLKLTGQIDWPWIWVLSPIWIPIILILGLLALAGIMIGIGYIIDSWGK